MKIAIFGGAFDPIHSEHIKVIKACKQELSVDKVIVLPSFYPPHKNNIVGSFEHRLGMLHTVLDKYDYVEISDIEKQCDYNPSYKTLKRIKDKHPNDEFYFIIGGDSIEYFDRWNKPEEIVKLVNLVVVKRKGYNNFDESINKMEGIYNIKITKLNSIGDDVSSTIIRASIILGLDTQNEDKMVIDYINKNGVYAKYNGYIEKLKTSLSNRTYNHCIRTTIYGFKLAEKQKMDFDKVFFACLLHDCAKNTKKIMEGVPQSVVHQYEGAKVAKDEYNIEDEEILSAIRYHTTGKPNMTQLEKLVYMADMLEEGREYKGVKELRKEVEKDFNQGFISCIKASLENLENINNEICLLTKQCYKYYTKKEDKQKNK